MIPEGAAFRRAEGLWYAVAPCRGLDDVVVTARRQGGDARAVLSRAQLGLLARLSAWHTAAELGVAHADLVALVDAHVAFWARDRPAQVLTGAPCGGHALRGNVQARPLLARGGVLDVVPHMPRRGELDDALLAGLRLEVIEWDTSVATYQLACCRAHAAALRDLVAGAPDDELRALLDELGVLDAHAAPAWDGAPRVTWVGHAGVLYEASRTRVVIDPPGIARSEPSRHPAPAYDLRDLGRLDAVLITHGDADHLDPGALIRVARTTPVVIPRAATPRPYHVDMRRLLDLLGFERVIELDAWARLPLGDVTVIAAPFVGEDWGLGDLPCLTYAITGPDLTIYANADARTDDATCDRLAAELAIDVAFLGVGGSAETYAMPPGYGYGHFYTPWIPAERHDEWVQMCNGPREAASVARRLRARHVFGYAAGGVPGYDLAYTDRGTHAELAALLGDGDPCPLDLVVGAPFTPRRARAASGPAPRPGAPPSR